MNNNFNLSRFWLLVQRQWTENKLFYTMIWCLLSSGMVFFGLFSDKFHDAPGIFLYFLVGAVITMATFPRWSDFGRSAGYILIPASVTEKFLCGLFYGIVLYTLVFCLTYIIMTYLVTYVIVFLFFSNNLLSFHEVIKGAINDFNPLRSYFVYFLTLMFAQSVCLICIIRFKKNQVLIFFPLFFGVLTLYGIGMQKLMTEIVNTTGIIIKTPGPFLSVMTPDFGYHKYINNQFIDEFFSFTKLIGNFNRWIWFAVFAILYLSSWFRLKEREL